jgi:hypothetical protein
MIISAQPRGLSLRIQLSEEEVDDIRRIVRSHNDAVAMRSEAGQSEWFLMMRTYGIAIVRAVIDRADPELARALHHALASELGMERAP